MHVNQFFQALLFAVDVEGPQVGQGFHKAAAKTLREEKGRTPVGAGGDELQLSRTVMALVERHDVESIRRPPVREESLRDHADPKNQGSAPAGGQRVLVVTECYVIFRLTGPGLPPLDPAIGVELQDLLV